jgi:putative (di)nucleoside polyphosphate hydrolase
MCVGIMLLNKDNKAFIGKRIDTRVSGWQMPQGGVDENEDLDKAVFRELKEETGVDNAKIIARTKYYHYYDLPDELLSRMWNGKYRGQQQIWFALKFLGDDSEINLNQHQPAEFSEWRWEELSEIPNIIVDFKKQLYLDVIEELTKEINK